MKCAPCIEWEAVARLAIASALLWLAGACREAPRDAGGALHREQLEHLTLQATSTEQWSPAGSLAQARDSHTATLLPSGKVLVAGGFCPDGYLASMEVYDPATQSWGPAGSMGEARLWHTATLLPSGKVLLVGGLDELVISTSAELYDPATGKSSTTAPPGTPRAWHTATLLHSGQVLVTGGFDVQGLPVASAELYDPATGRWSSTGSLATARNRHTATLLPSGKVLVIGGGSLLNSEVPVGSVEIYDPATGKWSTTSPLATDRMWHTATLLRSGQVLVAGGWKNSDPFLSAELYDPSTGRWSQTGDMGLVRSHHTATLLPSGKVLVTGSSTHSSIREELYDPDTKQWSWIDRWRTRRKNHTATLLPSGQVLVAAGYDSSDNYLANTELYDDDSGAIVRPILAGMVPQKPGATFEVKGSGFLGTQGKASIVRLQIFPDGELRDLPAFNLSGTALRLTLEDVPEGHHLLFVLADDVAGGQLLRVDGTPPGASSVSAPGLFTNTRSPVIVGTAEAGSRVTVLLDGIVVGTALSDVEGQWSLSPAVALTEGLHKVVVLSTDAAGNEGLASEVHGFTVDTLQPASPELITPGVLINSQTPAIGGTAEALSTVEVVLDGIKAGTAVADAEGTWSFTPPTPLSEGDHWAEASTRDRAGNASRPSTAHGFTVDSMAPSAPKVRASGGSVITPRAVIRGTADAGSTVVVSLDGNELGTTLADKEGSWSLTPATALEIGPHIVSAIARDDAGNTSEPSAKHSFLVSPRSHYGWSCASTSAFPTSWAMLVLAAFLGRQQRRRQPRGLPS